jgi:toxin CptA
VTAPVKLRIAIGPSPILAAVLAVAHFAALAVTLIVTLPVWARLLISTMIIASGAWSILSAALQRSRSAIVELEAGEGGRISCRTRDGPWREGQVLASSFISPWLTVLNLRISGAGWARHLVILTDNVEKEAFRRLRVLLRWSRQAPDGLPEETPH